ncbi:MAG: dihydrolipoamide acetyltransferase family protein [Alphaproteobacteria bacterium]|nr:dihydrolipoamide acetyltransferase family protein [Alphaproteobacteria bacterium]
MSAYEFKLPDIGEGLGEGEIVRWHAAPGEAVTADQALVDVETDKAVVEIPAPVSGVLKLQGGQPGDVIPVGGLLAVIESDGETRVAAEPAAAPAPESSPSATPPVAEVEAAPARRRTLASPATRKLAVELGVDLAAVTGSGERGRVTRDDVTAAAGQGGAGVAAPPARPGAAPQVAPKVTPVGEDRVEPLKGLRRQVARTMTQSWREIPHISSMREIEADDLVAARERLKEEFAASGVRLTYLSLFVKAVVAALKQNPSFNASIDMEREEIVYRHRYNVGIGTATGDGLIVTVLHDADKLSLPETARRLDELARKGRERKVSLEELSGGTFTITNWGSYGGWLGSPLIRPPEVAIAGFGRIRDAVVAVDGVPAVRKLLPLVVATDHRVNDGEHLGSFIAALTSYLSHPIRLLGQG